MRQLIVTVPPTPTAVQLLVTTWADTTTDVDVRTEVGDVWEPAELHGITVTDPEG